MLTHGLDVLIEHDFEPWLIGLTVIVCMAVGIIGGPWLINVLKAHYRVD